MERRAAPGRELVVKLASMFSEDNLASLRYLHDVPLAKSRTVYDLFKHFEEQGAFIPSEPLTITPFLEAIQRCDILSDANKWLEVKGYKRSPGKEYCAEMCILDALEFLSKMDEKIQHAARSNDIAEVTNVHVPCLQEFLRTAKTLVERCLENTIYAEISQADETYSYASSHASVPTSCRTEQVEKSSTALKQQRLSKKPPPVAPKPKRSICSELHQDIETGADSTGSDSGFSDRSMWTKKGSNSLVQEPNLPEETTNMAGSYTKLRTAPPDESSYEALSTYASPFP